MLDFYLGLLGALSVRCFLKRTNWTSREAQGEHYENYNLYIFTYQYNLLGRMR